MPPSGSHNPMQPELAGPSGSDWGELQLADDQTAAAAANGELYRWLRGGVGRRCMSAVRVGLGKSVSVL